MSPRENVNINDIYYQAKEVTLPEDHYKPSVSTFVRIATRRRWIGLVGAFGLLGSILLFLTRASPNVPHFLCVLNSSRNHCDGVQNDTISVISNDVIDSILLDLNHSLQGRVWISSLDSDDNKGFVNAARVWRQDISNARMPRAVVEVDTEKDVQLAIPILDQLQRYHQIPFRIRSGGHSKAGFSTVSNGIVLSLKNLKRRSIIAMDSNNNNSNNNNNNNNVMLATIEPGSTVEDVLDKFLEHATNNGKGKDRELLGGAIGQCGKVAEGGWVLGGGMGFMGRLLGLGIDNVLEFRVVLANGTIVTANHQQHPDLFWALRGAGQGNYGVVTSMRSQLYRVPDIQLSGKVEVPLQDLHKFFYRLGKLNIDGEIPGEFVAMCGGKGMTSTVWLSWFSLDEDVEKNEMKAIEHFNSNIRPILPPSSVIGPPTMNFELPANKHIEKDEIRPTVSPSAADTGVETPDHPYSRFLWAEQTHKTFDQGYGVSVYAAQVWQGFLLPENNTQQVWETINDLMTRGISRAPDLMPRIELWGGAIADVDVQDTAFRYRDAVYNLGLLLVIVEPDETAKQRFEAQVASVNTWWPQVADYLTGSYVNYPMSSLSREVYPRLYWGNHLERLVDVKQRYDPTNTFDFEQSMPLKL